MALVVAPEDIATIAAALARAPLVAFDLEFASADRLVPVLCLIQVAWLEEHVALDAEVGQIVAAVPQVRLVDPLAVDIEPIVRVLAEHPLVVAHAARQDLGLLATRFGSAMAGLVDTQVAAAFGGLGDQIGYAALANELLGVAIAKEHQFTNWQARPLSDAQLHYADADVRHLPALYAKLAARIGERLAWARAESAQVVADAAAAAAVTPETAWRAVGGVRGLPDDARAAVAALAAWRLRAAQELDRPLGQVLTDKLLVDIARARPSANALRSWKGLSPHARSRVDGMLDALAAAHTDAVDPAGRGNPDRLHSGTRARPPAPSMRAQRWSEMLVAIVHVIAEELQIAPRLLATRADAEEVARAVDDGGLAAAAELPAFSTWRRDVLGRAWEGFLTGRLAVVGDLAAPHGMRLRPC